MAKKNIRIRASRGRNVARENEDEKKRTTIRSSLLLFFIFFFLLFFSRCPRILLYDRERREARNPALWSLLLFFTSCASLSTRFFRRRPRRSRILSFSFSLFLPFFFLLFPEELSERGQAAIFLPRLRSLEYDTNISIYIYIYIYTHLYNIIPRDPLCLYKFRSP